MDIPLQGNFPLEPSHPYGGDAYVYLPEQEGDTPQHALKVLKLLPNSVYMHGLCSESELPEFVERARTLKSYFDLAGRVFGDRFVKPEVIITNRDSDQPFGISLIQRYIKGPTIKEFLAGHGLYEPEYSSDLQSMGYIAFIKELNICFVDFINRGLCSDNPQLVDIINFLINKEDKHRKVPDFNTNNILIDTSTRYCDFKLIDF